MAQNTSYSTIMEGFLPSLIPFLRKYLLEMILLCCAIGSTALSFIVFMPQTLPETISKPESPLHLVSAPAGALYVDISGSVTHPDVYRLQSGARLKDALKQAGGLTDDADKSFFGRNYNLARLLTDQEKIYIPSVYDTENGVVFENKRILDYTQPQTMLSSTELQSRISVNNATPEELDTLPSVGAKTAQLIIQNRPYTTLDELVKKKAVDQKVFDSLTNLISL